MDAALMSVEPHERGIHVVSGGGPGGSMVADVWRVTSAATPAPPERAAVGRRIIECQNSPYQGYNDTQSRAA
jgi:hypothetical protein